MKKSEKISIPTSGCLNLKNPAFVCRNYVFINDFNVLQKVPEKQGQNLPLASLYRINFLLTICIFPVAAMLTMPTSVTPTLSGGRTETAGQIGEFKAILRRD
jgi:hypothetical protein